MGLILIDWSWLHGHIELKTDWLLILYNTILCTQADLLYFSCMSLWKRIRMYWISTDVVYLLCYLAGTTWNCYHLGARSVYMIQICTMHQFTVLFEATCASGGLLVHSGLFSCFQHPPSSDMDYMIFYVCLWSFCISMHAGELGL